MGIRMYLTGRIAVEVDGSLAIQERQFRSRQERLAFAYLACHRTQPVTRERLAEVLWPEEMPPAWQTGMSAVLSRLRGLVQQDDLRAYEVAISRGFAQYQLCLPADTWVDIEAAAFAIDEAEGGLRAGNSRKAFGPATVAVTIARRPFLSGDDGEWAESQRRRL